MCRGTIIGEHALALCQGMTVRVQLVSRAELTEWVSNRTMVLKELLGCGADSYDKFAAEKVKTARSSILEAEIQAGIDAALAER